MRARRLPRAVSAAALLLASAVAVGASLPAPAAAQEAAQQPVVRARLDPPDSITVGQPVTVRVEVLVPSFFTGAPRFSDLDVPGALVVFNNRGGNLSERVGGRTWTGQWRSYTLYPQRPGDYELDGIEVEVPYSAGGAGTTARVAPDALRFEATVPPGAGGLSYFIATSQLDITQDVATHRTGSGPEDRALRIGESLTRTVTVTVQNALSMVVPPLELGALDGLAAYPAPPAVEDSSTERGALPVGTRRESTTFVAEREGSYRLPAVEVAWWDPSAQQLRRSSVPAIDIEVVTNPDPAADFVPADEHAAADAPPPAARVNLAALARRFGPYLLLAIAAIVVIARLARRLGYAAPHPWRRDPAARLEARRFREFRRAASSGEAPDVARSFMRWLDTWYRRPATYAEFSASADDPEMDRQGRALADTLYAAPDHRSGAWSGRDLIRRVRRARRAAQEADATTENPPLPPLNP